MVSGDNVKEENAYSGNFHTLSVGTHTLSSPSSLTWDTHKVRPETRTPPARPHHEGEDAEAQP